MINVHQKDDIFWNLLRITRMKIWERRLDTRQGPPLVIRGPKQPANAISLYKYTGIFPSSNLGKPATAAPMAPDCTDLVVNFIWKGIFCLHYSRVSQSCNRYGDESSSWIHQQGSGTKPKIIFMLFVQEPEVLTVPARYPPSNHLLISRY